MFYMFYEAKEPQTKKSKTPIVLWLQGGPGCSSLFGMVGEDTGRGGIQELAALAK